ncbi:MAG TPA: amino acid ABC transporter permease, partial [Thermoanaerobacterales bacterium]|nr:amino acid ABC transporter permease [Thermoanaerobacterales bacterium]
KLPLLCCPSIPYILKGIEVTLKVTILALIIGAILGLVLALMRVYGKGFFRRFSILYSRLIRSLPLIVILFGLYYFGSGILDLSAYAAVVFSLSIHTAAYQSEIFRGAIQSINIGQMEAALALGMSRFQCIFFVIIPQALRRALPYWSNEASIVLKDSSLAYILGITELLRRGEYVSARTTMPLLTYTIVGIIYFILTFVFSRGLFFIEKKLSIPE